MAEFFASLTKSSNAGDEQPIREELFSVERLEQYAQVLARDHRIVVKRGGAKLLPRVEYNGRKLVSAYQTLVEAIRAGHSISPAAEWLVDNFHIIEEQLRQIREDLPHSYYRELPKLADGELKDHPRIYALALALIAHTDSRLDTNTLRRFIAAYQTVAPLSIGELWAVAITLRLALVENLRRLAGLILLAREEREQADKVADRLLEAAARQPNSLLQLVTDRFTKRERIPHAFVVQLVQRLREQDPAVMPVMEWLEQQTARQKESLEQVIHAEHQRQAATQVTVGNIITSMRLLSTLDWQAFFESVSLVDPLLSGDPADAYAKMEFSSRDRYRHVVERISKRTEISELKIAEAAVELAEQSAINAGKDSRTAHVGYYLVDAGLSQLEAAFGYRPKLGERFRRWCCRHPTLAYLGSLSLLTTLIVATLLLGMYRAGADTPLLIATFLLALIPASDIALSILNWDVTHLFQPRLLPRMKTVDGIGAAARTMVVVPTIVSSEESVRQLLEKLEVHYLANQDQHLHFALLSDFADAAEEETPADAQLLTAALSGIAELNKRYSNGASQTFHLFHRQRRWNPSEGRWMGWERKRGKLHEFNQILRGARDTSFMVQTADEALMSAVRFVITLDSDTQLPRDVARKLVGTAIHPLNRPHFDRAADRVTKGYGILQPRVSISLESASRSRFARIFSGNTGIDPYTTAVSDVYQDLFSEGNYTGKGLYEVDTFEAALGERVPENSLLSHDLFESLFARAALITDIELLDDYPAHYDTYAKRQHRWTRGDWQISGWLLPRVPDAQRRKVRNTLPLSSRWKILDNLRRSLVAPSLMLWLLAAWLLFPGSTLAWSLFVILALAFPVYLHVTTSLLIHPRGIPWTSHFWSVWGDIRTNTAQVALSLVLLPHQAYLMSDAIIRTLYRKLISHRKLLEWVTAAQAESTARHDFVEFFWFMFPAEVLVVLAAVATLIVRPGSLRVMTPFVVVWAAAPFVAYWVSQRTTRPLRVMTGEDLQFARLVARRTWRFFETFVGTEDNWLPPDNFQEDPKPMIAHRTSPTNISMLLLSTLTAHDFGYIGSLEFVARQEPTFAALEKLHRSHGHFLNWHDTTTLQPLIPLYISTVDSGNLAGHLIALKQACIEIPDMKLLGPRVLLGLGDTLRAISIEAARIGSSRQRTEMITVRELHDEILACEELLASKPEDTLAPWVPLFESLETHAAVIDDIVGALSHEHGAETFRELGWWVGAFSRQIQSFQNDLHTLAPWAQALSGDTPLKDVESKFAVQLSEILKPLSAVPAVVEVPELLDSALVQLAALQGNTSELEPRETAERVASAEKIALLTATLEDAAGAARTYLSGLTRLAQQCEQIFEEMDFRFLFDEERKLFTIGYNVTDLRPDNSYYDLLASEARLASFVAIAKGDVSQQHWFRLGRQLTSVDRSQALISWTGTMFEYLMPLLVMRTYEGTLLHQSYQAVVGRQIEYGRERGVPWGISESAYNVRDLQLNYQYGPFGVPGLGLKRGLIEDLVITPYATFLAAMVRPRAAIDNLRLLEKEGALSGMGFFEAIDYTAERLPQNQKRVLIRALMTHHQGMSLVALNNALHNGLMEQRFHSDPLVQATELLLQERIPVGVVAAHPRAEEVLSGRVVKTETGMVTRTYSTPDLETPRTQLLSNGTYHLMITTAGSGYSACGRNAVTRWREDVTRDHWGAFIYLRDVRSGIVWSAGHQPVQRRPQSYEVLFSEDKADFWRIDAGIVTHMEVVVSAEEDRKSVV